MRLISKWFLVGALPFLKDGDRLVSQQQIAGYVSRKASQPAKFAPTAEETAFHALIDSQLLPLVLHSLFSVRFMSNSVGSRPSHGTPC